MCRGWQLSHRSRRAVSRAHGRRVHRETTGTSATAVTAPLALGCESGGRGAGKGGPALENPGRTVETFEGHLAAPGKDGEAEPDTVTAVYGRLIASSPPHRSRPSLDGRGAAPRGRPRRRKTDCRTRLGFTTMSNGCYSRATDRAHWPPKSEAPQLESELLVTRSKSMALPPPTRVPPHMRTSGLRRRSDIRPAPHFLSTPRG